MIVSKTLAADNQRFQLRQRSNLPDVLVWLVAVCQVNQNHVLEFGFIRRKRAPAWVLEKERDMLFSV